MPNHNPPRPSGEHNVNIQVTDGQLGWAPDSLLVTTGKPVVVTFTLVNSPGAILEDISFIDGSMQTKRVSDTQWQTDPYNPRNHKGKNDYSITVVTAEGLRVEDDPDVNNEPPGGDDGDGDGDQGGGEDPGGAGDGGETKNNQ
jgi:hypothetical protein